MKWVVKKYCPLFSCCSANDAVRPVVHRVNRSIGVSKRPPKQKQGLLDLLSSYQLAKNDPHAEMREWALQWAASGTLLHLVRIALRLGARVETSSMELVCLNAALIVAYLPENNPYLRDFLNCTMQLLGRPAKRSSLGVYRLLLVLLRFESLRREASASGFVEKLHEHYHRIVFLSPSSEQTLENEESSVEDSEDEESSVEEEIIDDLYENEPNVVVVDLQPVGVIPKLNFAWLKNVPSHDSTQRCHDRSLSIDKSGRTEIVTTISDRSSPETSERCKKTEQCTEQSTPVDGRSLQRIKNLFWPRRGDGDDAMHGMGHVLHCLGLSETISLLGNLNDTYFTRKYDDVPYPVHEWRLTPFLKERNQPQDREELAMLEVFLNVAPEKQHASASIKMGIMKSIVSDILNRIHMDTLNHNILEHCIAVYVEYSVPLLIEESEQDAPCARLVPDTNTQEAEDTLLEMLVKEIHKIASLRRPGESVFHKLNLLLMVTSEYFRKSPMPTKIVNNLVFTLNSAQKTYIKSAGHVLQWAETHVQAFRSLLSFYESIFKKCMSVKDRILFEKLVIQAMDESWKGLLKDFCEAILFSEPYPWLHQTQRDQIVAEILLYFTSLMKGFACFDTQQSMQGGYLDDFGFLLAPKLGLATVILDTSDVATLVQEQVLRFIMTSCSLKRTTFISDTVMIESYLKLIIVRLLELWQKTPIDDSETSSLMTLCLQAITAVMRCCSCSGLTLVLRSGIVGLLVNEINMTTQDETSPGVRVHPCYTVSSRLSSSRDSHRQSDAPPPPPPPPPRTEPVEIFQTCHSLSDAEGEESLVPTFNSDLPFQTLGEVLEERPPYVSSSSSGTVVFNAPHGDLVDDTFENNQRLFFGEKTVDQVKNELFGDHSIHASVESDEYSEDTEDDEWPSDLSVHGDIEEDGRRWERYQTQKKFQNGRISFEEMQSRLAALSATSATEDDDPEPIAPIPPFAVPVLDFDRLKSGHSEGASALISEAAPSHCGEFPSVLHPPHHPLGSGKQQIESTVSPLELSPVHQRNGSMFSCGASSEPTGRLIHEHDIHLAAVEFLIELLLLLDRYEDQSTVHSSDLVASISSGLYHDLHGPHFVSLIPELLRRIQDRGADALRMLRLFLEDLFEVEQYETLDRIHKGEMAHVKRCALKRSGKDLPETCVVKVINLPREILRSDASILSIYSEISLMERLSQESGFCQIYDFGVRSDSAYIVMQDCRCSLRDWVERFPVSSSWAIRLILKIFVRIAKSVQRLHQKVIVHFDLKCSNILLKGGPSNEGFWFPNNENPEFDILLADFGVARCYEGQDQLGTVRNRGTEYSKAPEMLLLTNMPQKSVRNYDRRRVKGVGTSSDVWALGCLLFELLTGEMLHFDRDWARFYTRVTQEVLPLFDDDKVKLLHLSYRSAILELLRFILVRDPQRRPTVAAIIDRVEQLLDSHVLPRYRPPFTVHRLPQIPSISMPHELERVPHTEWLCRLLSGDLHFTLYLTKLRLSVTILDGNLHSPQFLQFMEFMNASLLSGILYIENTAPNQKSNFARGFLSRIKGFCSRRQTEILFVPLIFSGRNAILHEIKCAVNRWCRYKSPEWTLSLTTTRDSALPFLDVLLDIIMTIEECPCLKAISILKARVKGG